MEELKEKKAEAKESENRLMQRESSLDKREEILQKRDLTLDEKENNQSTFHLIIWQINSTFRYCKNGTRTYKSSWKIEISF